jgi:hypothetical protein
VQWPQEFAFSDGQSFFFFGVFLVASFGFHCVLNLAAGIGISYCPYQARSTLEMFFAVFCS